MLVLSRKKNEDILIKVPGFETILIKVVETRGERVRLGFEAPREILIVRSELEGKNAKK